jgi:hypothetical protein
MLVSPEDWFRGYITQRNWNTYALNNLASFSGETRCRALPAGGVGRLDVEDISVFVDRTPITLGRDTPDEVVGEGFGEVGCRYACIVEEGRGVGVVIKKRF